MKGIELKFYVHEQRKHEGYLLYEWLLKKAQELKIQGGSAYRAIAGYGRHGILAEEHFFELSANLAVEVMLLLSEEECQNFLELIEKEKLDLVFVKQAVEFGITTKKTQ